ncbi:MAG: hypothetical protein RIT35_1292 [Pseudomonadota bacterium]|jgi:putative permease
MKLKEQIILISTVLIMVAFFYLVREILFPFIMAGCLAYFLSPVVDKITKACKSRIIATSLILLTFFIIIIIASIFIIPLIYNQVEFFIGKIPYYKNFITARIIPYLQTSLLNLDPAIIDKVQNFINNLSSSLFTYITPFLRNIVSSSMGLINIFSLFLIIPLLTFYLLLDWHKIVDCLHSLLPPKFKKAITTQLQLIDLALSGYIRGQFNICLILIFYYGCCLRIIGLDYFLLLAVLSGVLFYLPYIGPLTGLLIASVLAYLQFGDFMHIFYVFFVFAGAQILEGGLLTPKLVGDKIGLHPVWIIFAVFAGGSLMGLSGIIIATPLAAITSVLIRLTLKKYRQSSLFKAS